MESLARLHNCHQTLHLSLNHRGPSFAEPISSLFLTTPSPSSSSSAPISASSSPSSSSPDPLHRTLQNPKPVLSQTLKSLLRRTLPTIASTATAALLFTRLRFHPIPLTPPLPTTQQPVGEINAVKISYFDLKVKIKVVDFVLELKPHDQALHLLKTQIREYIQELESARFGFQEMLAKDLLCYRNRCGDIRMCLEMADELEGLSREIEAAIDICKHENIKFYLKNFKNLVTRVRDSKGVVFRALKYFQELEHEEDNEQ